MVLAAPGPLLIPPDLLPQQQQQQQQQPHVAVVALDGPPHNGGSQSFHLTDIDVASNSMIDNANMVVSTRQYALQSWSKVSCGRPSSTPQRRCNTQIKTVQMAPVDLVQELNCMMASMMLQDHER